MRHFTTPEFWRHFERLPEEIQRLAKKDFELLKENPRHSSLRLKKAGKFWTVRVGIHYRAIAKERAEGLNWFWIGHHSEYDTLLS
jgi:mRNA-degrading endonuclease RelE of RelBE toxin-antitoxin system